MVALVLLCLFIGLPMAEILTFIEVGGRIGGLATIAATIATAFIGAALFRYQGMHTLARAQSSLEQGHMPLEEVIGGLGLLLAAICLFIPGFVTDVIGFLLFIPALRLVAIGALLRPMMRNAQVRMSARGPGPTAGPFGADGTVIDGDYRDVSEPGDERPALPEDKDANNGTGKGEKS
jgi:UPF0716 protein FxsA